VDLRHTQEEPTRDERAAIDELLGPEPEGGEPTLSFRESRARRHRLLPALHALQDRVGWVSRAGLGYVCRRLGVPPAEGYGVASFYALFALEPRPRVVAHVCTDLACKLSGGERVLEEARRARPGEVLESPCLGLCEAAPAALVTAAGPRPTSGSFGPVDTAWVLRALDVGAPPSRAPFVPMQERSSLRLLRRVGHVDPESLDAYRAAGGLEGLRRARELGPRGVIHELSLARLAGRGGAAFPTGRKWAAVAAEPGRPKYVVCNADESEPGTFKDRALLEGDPFAVLEATLVAAYAVGADKAYVYVRGEYPLAAERLERAARAMRERGLFGEHTMGRGPSLELEVRRGAGAYICGEETALFASIEGYRGEPRTKPPFPTQAGLFGRPTLVNNVETLVAALAVVAEGAEAHLALGTAESTGTRLFCLSGAIAWPGVYEVPQGTPLGALLELAGGVPDERRLGAVLLGGAAGSFVGPEDLDLPLSLEGARARGATLGSGVVMVFDEGAPMLSVLQRIAAFFRDESCGQCVPCRIGTVRQEELLARLARRAPLGSWDAERALFADLEQVLRDASICGLGQTAASAISSGLRRLPLWPDHTIPDTRPAPPREDLP
jgi:NADH-quinone oxidoreductase subunit F